MSAEREISWREIDGFRVGVDITLGHLWVEHDGTITWDELQAIKNEVWGPAARAIEVYPAAEDVVNNAPLRHLWLLGLADFAPDLLGHKEPDLSSPFWEQSLENRSRIAWEGV